ncbi:GIY-YIG nuclease family protein [Candidatus Peregrinibacteria bacterium]|nr:GIY-YIG nuclease family protein [Candidatus Peregrinibacteria bacterium]
MRQYDYYVYMLRCNDGSYYTSITNSVVRRLWQHQNGINPDCYTFSRRPVELVYSAWFTNVFEAIHWEKQIKRWSRKKKEALIRGEWQKIQECAKRRTPFPKYNQSMSP